MLVLTRKINEAVHIGRDIRVVVVAIEGDRVRLGIDAPGDLDVKRAEKTGGEKTL